MKVLLVLAAVADLVLAALLVGVSGFIFGSGPESMHGGGLLVAAYALAVIACVAAPVMGFILSRRGKAGLGLFVALLPLVGALIAVIVPAPY